MITRYELEQMRVRLDRIEHEVGGARLALEALERRAVPEPEAKSESAAPPPLPPVVETRVPPPASDAVAGSASDPGPKRAAVAPGLPIPVVKPPPAAMPRSARDVPLPEPLPLRVWLERLQLWPPAAGEGSAEARLGAWWATRIGALLAVIGVVFFGIYVSLHTPPWVKFCELLAVSLGVSGLGLWLERRLPAFGGVVFAGGLALLFFTAYAGYVVPGVRVFDSLWASVAWQGVAVALIVAVALWRRAPLIATLAVGLGHVTAIFSGRDGFDGFALGAAALLGLVAVTLRRLRSWEGPSVVAMPAGYAVLFLGLYAAAGEEVATLPFAPWPFIAGMAALFFLRDWRRVPVETAEVTAGERWFQNANASLAALAALVTALGWYRAQLGTVYLLAAGAFAAAAWARSRQVRGGDGVVAVLTAKAAGALTLGVIELAEARTVALALLVQAWVLAWTARRLGSRVLAVATGLTAAVATWFFFRHGVEAAPALSIPAAQALLFTVGLAALATEAGRWLVKDADGRFLCEALAASVAATGAALGTARWTPAGWEPALAMGWALIFLGVAWARAGRAAAWAAAVLAGLAQLWLWLAANPRGGEVAAFLFWNALAVLGPTLAAGAWMGGRAETNWRAGGTLAWALATIGLVFAAYGLLPPQLALALVAVVGAAAAQASAWSTTRHLPWLATLGIGLGWWLSLRYGSESLPAGWLGLAALAAWALPAGLRAFARCDAVRRAEVLPETMERLQVIVATALALRALVSWLDGAALAAGLAAFAGGLFLLALRPGLRPALAASWAVWGFAAIAMLIVGRSASWLAFVAALAWVPAWLWVRAPVPWLAQFTGWRRHAPAVQCTLAILVGLVCAHTSFAGADEVLALTALVGVAAFSARPGRVKPAPGAACVVALFLAWGAFELILRGGAEGFGAGLGAVALAALTLAALPLWLEAGKQPVARAAGGGAALALLLTVCAAQNGALAPYATVGWGLASIALFMGGLFWRNATYRVLGLIGLALCVPRIFVVDLHSMLHRIVAFIVIGVVMLWVGFSYHRFRHLVTDAPAIPPSSS